MTAPSCSSILFTILSLVFFRQRHLPIAAAAAFSLPSIPLSSSSSPASSSPRAPRGHARTTNLQMSSSPSIDLGLAKRGIAQAISIGAPSYNAGDIKGCADVYEKTALDIVPKLPETLRSKLQQTLDEISDGSVGGGDDARAWALRRQFDEIVGYEPPFAPTAAAVDTTLEPFTSRQLPPQPLGVMDNVMGGVSSGNWISDTRTFVGTTSLANNGGFASLRWRFDTVQNWSYAKGVYLKVRHSKPKEHTFRIILKDSTCERVRLSNFKAVFANSDDSDDTDAILIPFSELGGMEQMGSMMEGAPAFNPSEVTEIGIMAIKPTVVGDFDLTIDDWGLYS